MKRLGAYIAFLLSTATFAVAQVSDQDHTWSTPGNAQVNGQVQLCTNASSLAVPCQNGTTAAGYPAGATPIVAVGAGSTASVAAAIAGASGKTSYICGFQISSLGGTATSGPVTMTNVSATMTFQLGVNSGTATATNFTQTFSPCLPSTTVNTTITVATTANASGTAVDVQVWGYRY